MNEVEEANKKIEELEKENNKLEKDKAYWENKAFELETNLDEEVFESNVLRKRLNESKEVVNDFIYNWKLKN